MRLTLLLFSFVGLLVIGLIASILTGVIHVSPLPGSVASTMPLPQNQQAAEPSDAGDEATRPATEPDEESTFPATLPVERTIVLNAADAQLQGKAALMAKGTRLVRDGDGRGERRDGAGADGCGS